MGLLDGLIEIVKAPIKIAGAVIEEVKEIIDETLDKE